MKGLFPFVILTAIACLVQRTGFGQCVDAPDLVIVNAHIITMDPAHPSAEAIAVRDGLILLVGTEEEVVSLIPEHCPVQWVDAAGLTVLPGFNDAHCHWLSWREHICDIPGHAATTYPDLDVIMDTLSMHGWTSISELNFGRPDFITDHLQNAMALETNGDLHVRINGYWGTYDHTDLLTALDDFGYGPGHAFSDRIRAPGVKIYVDDPFGTMDIMDQATCTDLVTAAHNAGYQVAAHCVNETAVEKILNAYESALGDMDNLTIRHRIEHAVKVSDAQFQRMEDKGILASFQLMGPPDWPDQNTFQTYISNTNTDFVLRWKDFMESNIPTVGSTDAPFNNSVCHYSPFRAIYQAVTRIGYLDRPHAQWELDQRIAIEEGLRLLTINGAWATKEETVKGSLETGKYADLTIVSADPLTVSDPEELLDIGSVLTMVGGQIEYCSQAFCSPATAFRVDTMIVTVSDFLAQETPPLAFDANEDTNWGAGNFPPQYIQLDFRKNTTLDHIELVVGQFPQGFTLHRLSGATDSNPPMLQELHTFGGVTNDNDVLTYTFDPGNRVFRYLRVETIQSPSWVSWKEIRIFREGPSSIQGTLESGAGLRMYPVPATSGLTLELELPVAEEHVEIRLMSMDGKALSDIYNGTLNAGKHQFQLHADVLNQLSGKIAMVIVEGQHLTLISKVTMQ